VRIERTSRLTSLRSVRIDSQGTFHYGDDEVVLEWALTAY